MQWDPLASKEQFYLVGRNHSTNRDFHFCVVDDLEEAVLAEDQWAGYVNELDPRSRSRRRWCQRRIDAALHGEEGMPFPIFVPRGTA